MESKDKKRFAGLMAMMDEAFGQESSKQKATLYFESLKEFEIGEVESAVYRGIATLKFYPKVAELREFIEGDPNSRALIAWRTAVDNRDWTHSYEFDDPAIHYCIHEIFGDWVSFCEKTNQELRWEEKRFLDLYRLTLKRPDLVRNAPKRMLGSFEIHNAALGFLEHVPEVRKVESMGKKPIAIEPPEEKKQIEP